MQRWRFRTQGADKGKRKVGVRLGISNGVKTEVVAGIREGQQVVLQ